MKVRTGWKSDLGRRTGLDARQVKCLTLDAGHVWIHAYDRLPPRVRQRMADSPFNICPACMDIEAHSVAAACGLQRPTISIYFGVIAAIERELNALPC
jgi:hypothetical protein